MSTPFAICTIVIINLFIRTQTFRPYQYLMHYKMKEILLKEAFDVADLFGNQKNLWKIGLLNNISAQIPKGNKYTILCFFSSYCDNCAEGTLLREIKGIYERGIAEAGVIFFEPFNINDIEYFKQQLDVKFPVSLASEELLSKWRFLKEEYSPVELSTMVFMASEAGEIVYTYYNGCDCYVSFLNILRSLKYKTKGRK